MTRFRPCYLLVAFLIVYGMVLPNAVTNSASAHNTFWDLVRNGHLNYVNELDPSFPGGDFSSLIRLAESEWQSHADVAINEVSNRRNADVIISSFCGPKINALAFTYDEDAGQYARMIRVNRCVLMHKCPDKKKSCGVKNDGGRTSKTKLYSTTSSRRARTFVHEFGHALGLDHNGLVHWDSVMSTILRFRGTDRRSPIRLSNSATTTYDLQPHDIDDIEKLWP